MTKELVIGASGLVGSFLMADGAQNGADIHGTYCHHPKPGLHPLDLTDTRATAALLDELQPEIIYLPAANPNVDWVEEHPEQSRPINVDGPLALIGLLRNSFAKLVYYSTDYVFDGESGPYRESDTPNPLGEYARQKVAIEQAIADRLSNWLVLRVTVVYGWESQGKNFAIRAVRNLREGRTLTIPNDQYNNPSYAPNIATASRVLASQAATGIFHLAGADVCHRFEFARQIAREFGLPEDLVQPVDTPSLKQRTRRPLRAGMIVEKAQSRLPFALLGYREGLRTMRADEPKST